jgi:hypothetical protein
MSHFVSLDSSGKAIIWVASQASGATSSADGGVDYGLSPWGKMRLVRQRVLYGATTHPFDAYGTAFPSLTALISPSSSLSSCPDFGRDLLPRSQPVLGLIPGDTSTFLLSYDGGQFYSSLPLSPPLAGGHGGAVKKVVRYDTTSSSATGTPAPPKSKESLLRSNKTHVVVNLNDRSDSKEDEPMGLFNPITLSSFTPPASCIAVSPNSFALSNASESKGGTAGGGGSSSPLVLIGRTDGSVDLFYFENGEILSTWSDLSIYQPSSSASSSSALEATAAIVYAAWVAWNSPSFLLIDSHGFLFYFDLFRDSSRPLFVENLSISSSALLPNVISLSSCRSIGGMVHLALGEVDKTVGNHGIKVRKVSDELVWSSSPLMSSGGRGGEEKGGSEGKEDFSRPIGPPSAGAAGAVMSLSSGSQALSSSWMGRVTGSNVVLEYRSTTGRK